MSFVKRYAEGLAEKLAREYCRRTGKSMSFEIADAAFLTVTSGPETGSEWDQPWVIAWLMDNDRLTRRENEVRE